jgi:hypothetical protein
MSRHDTTIFSLHFWQMLQKLSRQLRKGQVPDDVQYTCTFRILFFFSYKYCASRLTPVRRRVRYRTPVSLAVFFV